MVVVFVPVHGVKNFEINLSILIKSFSSMMKKFRA